jgi:hypothetical protein
VIERRGKPGNGVSNEDFLRLNSSIYAEGINEDALTIDNVASVGRPGCLFKLMMMAAD